LENGTNKNLGCSNDTPLCSEKPHFNDLFKVRVNTPPCCRDKILQIYRDMTNKLEKHNIVHFIQFGGLIGYYRNKHFIPYDTDFDLYIDKEDWKQQSMVNILKELRQEFGYNHEYKDDGRKLKIFYSNINNNSIDVWPFSILTEKNGIVYIPHYSAVNQPLINIFPLRRVEFEGAWTYIPRKSKEVLDLQYGQGNWEDEIDCKEVVHEQCVHVKKKVEQSTLASYHASLLSFLLCIVTLVMLIYVIIKCARHDRSPSS